MLSVPQERQCKREGCPNSFPLAPGKRGRPQEFCSEQCSQIHFIGALDEDVRKAQQRARKYQSNLRRREFLAGMEAAFLGLLLEKWPQGKTAQHEAAWNELRDIRHLLWLSPDPHAAIARARATALQEQLAPLISKDRTAARIWIYCEEIKRDADVAGESEGALRQEEAQVITIKQLWDRQRDHLNFAYALLSHAHLDRIRLDRNPGETQHADRAKHRILAALDVLTGPCYKQDKAVVNILRHLATLMRFRLEAFYYKDESAAKQTLAELWQLAEQINERIHSPRTFVETLREEAGYRHREFDESTHLLNEANARFQKLDTRPIPAQLSLMRPQLEILRVRRDPRLNTEVMTYLDLLQQHPSAYNLNQLRKLLRACGADPAEIEKIGPYVPTIYTTPIMTYLYYEDFSLRREGML